MRDSDLAEPVLTVAGSRIKGQGCWRFRSQRAPFHFASNHLLWDDGTPAEQVTLHGTARGFLADPVPRLFLYAEENGSVSGTSTQRRSLAALTTMSATSCARIPWWKEGTHSRPSLMAETNSQAWS